MNTTLLGLGRRLVPLPQALFEKLVSRDSAATRRGLAWMSHDHHRVRDFVVVEIPKRGAALSPATIANRLDLSAERVVSLLDDLEKHLTFIYRDERENVVWAYPVTAEPTPHKLFFSSGEQIYGA